jgi:Domain of unknown function (DU1801)
MKRFEDARVAAVFDGYPRPVRAKLMRLRQLIFDTAAGTEGVGKLTETLKWGQVSYLTEMSKSGTTIRIDAAKDGSGRYAMYVHCQTNLIESFRRRYPHAFRYEGNRAVLFDANDDVRTDELKHCIAMALTYHQAKKRPAPAEEKT